MEQELYYQINRSEFLDRILTDEITKANEARTRHEEFAGKNKLFRR